MRRSFTLHAGAQLALATAALAVSACAAVPGLPPLPGEGILLGAGFALLFPLHAATIFRSWGHVSDRAYQWQAFKALPHRVHALLVGLGLAGGLLLSGAFPNDGTGLQATEVVRGRYFAVDTTDPERRNFEVTRSRYEALSKQGQRDMFAIYGLVAAGGGALTLIFAKLDSWAGRS
ncbi:hypothetical protein [Streptomyces sp. NPDC085529]|uniref:hypothetical protein n=1 Tax=Streptomyces sp. NPDC085529 TaxID=3365729 RepID=UPI0037D5CB6B